MQKRLIVTTTYNYTPTALELFQLEGGEAARRALDSLWEEELFKVVINAFTLDGEEFDVDIMVNPELPVSAYLLQEEQLTSIKEWIQTSALHLCFNLRNDDGGRFNLTLEREGNKLETK